ncbi:MAG TPA: RNB domain-containing ribonuclease [Herpetosiphonaceae bacterium]
MAEQPATDYAARARSAMREAGFLPEPPPAALAEAATPAPPEEPAPADNGIRDLRHLPWSSIDNPESRDLDQIEVAEAAAGGAIRILLGIADVAAFVPAGSAVDRFAGHNTTSVYAGLATFPMLPASLSEDRTSLLPGEDRLAVVIDMLVAPDGSVGPPGLSLALARNQARLSYAEVGAWLEGEGPPPANPGGALGGEALLEQIRLQDEAARRLQALRRQAGALEFETIEARPVLKDGQVVDLVLTHKDRARAIIENLMIAANSAMAGFLSRNGAPAIQRVVRTPERWDRIAEVAAKAGESLPPEPDAEALAGVLARQKAKDPTGFPDFSLAIVKLLGAGTYTVVQPEAASQGHFGLAVAHYTHSTAPNRRYADLITQRLLRAVLAGAPPPYPVEELERIAAHCNERATAARAVERDMRKLAAVALLAPRIGETFDAMVTGVKSKGVFVRLLHPPAEGRIVAGEAGLDVGDLVRVRLVAADPDQSHIDFARADEEPAPA